MPNWDDLRLFAAIAAAGSLSAAARRLKLSQPTMSRRLQALEAQMGAKLLERVGGGPAGSYVLTPKGAELLPLVERMVEAGEAIERARPDFTEDATGIVRVASGPMTIRFIARRLPELLDALPGIEIELYSSYSLINLSRREADIALRNRRPEEGRLAMRALPQPTYAVFGSKVYVARHPVAATEARYEECRWIGFDDTRGYSESLLWLTAKLGRAPHIRCSNASTILDALVTGAGLAVLPCFLAAEEPSLVQLTAPIDDLDREGLWLVVHEDMRDRPRVRLAADRIAALFHRYRHQLQPEGAG
ncbi:LysR family transcriptional regulator [Dongia deserti]|uniref:LysR family transcriptional regulator n=1 Tax=Dongia deserti TaxID=2268030 RepID=UPI0013C4BE65|nr:LysR family transcriptional regulator [Dongia deserti]